MECVTAVASCDGTVLAHRQQGPINMARWHTAQIRLQRIYMAEQRPSDELTTLAVYRADVYVPTVMSIRHRPDLVEAPKHFFNQLERQRHHLTGDALDAVQRSLCRSSYMAHPKALLLAMLGDERKRLGRRRCTWCRRLGGAKHLTSSSPITPQSSTLMHKLTWNWLI